MGVFGLYCQGQTESGQEFDWNTQNGLIQGWQCTQDGTEDEFRAQNILTWTGKFFQAIFDPVLWKFRAKFETNLSLF